MACSLTYDDQLSRVRIDADSLCVTGVIDTFTRSVTGGWGSTDTGQAWTVTGTASEYGVTAGVGRQTNTTEAAFRGSVLNISSTNCDYTVSVATDKVAAGNVQIVELAGRYTDTSNLYAARIQFATTGVVTIDLRKRVAGVETVVTTAVTTALTHGAGTSFRIRFSVQDTTIKARIWLTSATEPTTWDVEGSDGALTTGSSIALRSVIASGTSNEPIVFSWDNLATATVGYAVVERSTNGVNYTTVRGASEVGITTGCELERTVDDYEFPVGEEVTYRVRSVTDDGTVVVSTTCQITVDLDDVWIKSIGRPFLNQVLNCVGNPTPITRRARNGISPIVGRSFPVAVTDVRGSRELPLQVITRTTQEREDLDLVLASGDPVYLQAPAGHPLPTMYAVIEDTTQARPVRNRNCDNDWRLFTLPLVEVAAPGPDVVGSTGTWQTVVNTYATWADVLAAHSSWASLLELIGDGSEVIVP